MSIIIPAYNTAPYVFRAIESSLRQTHPNIEVLVIDDGSTDDTLRVAESYAEKDKRVRVFHQENAGVSAARNHGIREARGEYLMFLDSDDWLDDNCAEVLLGLQLKNPVKLIASERSNAYFREDGKIFRITEKPRMTPRIISSVEESVVHFWTALSLTSACFKIFSAEILRKGNIHFREGIHAHEDGLFVFDYLNMTGGFVYTNQTLWTVLRRSNSATRNYSFRMVQSVIEADNIMMRHPSNTPAVKEFCSVYKATCLRYFIVFATKLGLYEDAEFLRNYLKDYVRKVMRAKYINIMAKIKFASTIFLPPRLLLLADRIQKILRDLLPKDQGHSVEEWLQPRDIVL